MKRSTARPPATGRSERGAAAVEFALVAPVLLALVGGIVEFSHAYNLQISVTQAAREAARTMAIENDQALARTAAIAGAPGLNPGSFTFAFAPGACAEGLTANVTVTYTANTLTGLLGGTLTMTGVGAMRCGG
ncbi:TadE/TadG family type IV pilus assembly protein [Arthrobacter sp. Soil763]|uniref:TadE/TadG family type IV pilus assembly protein n=1 Tax=Arthrobacter sp. Soil763 TaxID=1736402 RepID=UPI0006F7244B|nr:TadE/TadG family type IV pilus assembly protein [Arthrobacter sp. Soil763]KRE79696.1 TadE family protein [Arthrobacter sp. Soil763]